MGDFALSTSKAGENFLFTKVSLATDSILNLVKFCTTGSGSFPLAVFILLPMFDRTCSSRKFEKRTLSGNFQFVY